MLLYLKSKDLLCEARERLTELGLEHTFLPQTQVFELKADASIYAPRVIKERLEEFGRIEGGRERTPLLDLLPARHEVVVKGRTFAPISFRNQAKPVWIAGPCSLDEENDIRENAKRLSGLGVQVLRGGAVKPRTSPHEFQGLGNKGFQILAEAAHEFGLAAVSEALSEADVEEAVRHLDIIQVGARNMQNFPLLKKLGRAGKPILLKRAPGSTLREWALAAEYLLSEGNRDVILCERGVRGLERELRYTLDLAGAAFMQERYSLPLVIDPSHATGLKQILAACTAGILAMGFAGIMLETHPHPVNALSDSLQALAPADFAAIADRFLRPAAVNAIDKH